MEESFEVVSGKMSLTVSVDSGEGVMDIECRSSGTSLLRNFNLLIGVQMSFKSLEEHITGLFCEIELLGDFLAMYILCFSVL